MDRTVQPSTAKARLHTKQIRNGFAACGSPRRRSYENNRDNKQERESARGHDTKSVEGIQVGKTPSHGFVAASTISGVTCFMQR